MSNYSSRKLEMLALKWAVVDKFRDYLVGRHFTVFTDNNPLSHLQTAKLGAVESRWCAELEQFNFTVKYKSGQDNTVADELSRLPHEIEGETEDEYTAMHLATEFELSQELWTDVELKDQQGKMDCFGGIRKWLSGGLTKKEVNTWLKDEDFCKLYRVRKQLVSQEEIVYHKLNMGVNLWRLRPVLPPSLQLVLLQTCHDLFGHQGRDRTLGLVQTRGYWPGMVTSIREYVAQCEQCGFAKDEYPSPHLYMGKLEASKPWEMMAMDFTVLERSNGIENVLIVTDVFTRFAWAVPTKDQKAATVANVLKEHIFDKFGPPERLLTDQGRNFMSVLIRQLCKRYGVEKVRTSPYHPQGNGVCERFNRTLHGLLVTLEEKAKKRWPEHLSALVAQYNATPHATTGCAPFQLLFGREAKLPQDPQANKMGWETVDEWINDLDNIQRTIWKLAKDNEEKKKTTMHKGKDAGARESDLVVGQEVLLRNNVKIGRSKIQNHWHAGRWTISEVLDGRIGVYRIRNNTEEDPETRVENRKNLRAAPPLRPLGERTGAPINEDTVIVSPRKLRSGLSLA